MTVVQPWSSYDKDHLPHGLAHVLGRDQIESALRAAGATLWSLSLGRPAADPRTSPIVVFDVYWVGDAKSPLHSANYGAGADRLLMRWQAVPSELRHKLSAEIVERWLPEACAWAAAAPTLGNVWQATDHRWMLMLDRGTLSQQVVDY